MANVATSAYNQGVIMKKFLTLFLCALTLVGLFALPACDDKKGNNGSDIEAGVEFPEDEWTNNY